MKHISVILIAGLIILSSCTDSRKVPDVSNINVSFIIIPFYKDLAAIPPDSVEKYLPALKEKYGSYLEAISVKVLRIGSVEDEKYPENLKAFLEYDANKDVFRKLDSLYPDINTLKPEIEQAFKYYKYYFPDKLTPDVYFHISGFNQSVVVDSAWLSVSLEKYLGENCIFYKWLEIYQYLRRQMIPQKIVPDMMKAIALTEFSYRPEKYNLLNSMVYQGKVLYFIKSTCPELPDTLLFDFTEKQLKWTKEFESDIWGYMIEQKHLFSTDRLVIQKYTGDGPFNSYLGKDSPGKIGGYFGYKIVDKFMNKNKNITLKELMEIQNGQKILSQSGYAP
ncbi:MAG: gliding motility protein GldB [Chlorobi bacterium]|nr:gliding motility protein GldB [Chlorobiota bacterium]